MVEVYAECEGNRYLLSAKNHATGSDVVCAAVSALVFAVAGYVKTAEAKRKAQVYNFRLDSGNALVHCHGDRDVGTAFETVLIGLKQIELSHPDLIKVDWRE
jgi:uncharacterized protein YsxB (DUF464 family)